MSLPDFSVYSQLVSGAYMKKSDRSGPYAWDGSAMVLTGFLDSSNNGTAATLTVTTGLVGNSGAKFDLYNTADQTTNYERLRADWSGSIARILTQFGGSAGARTLRLGVSVTGVAPDSYIEIRAGAPFLNYFTVTTSQSVGNQWNGSFTASSGTQTALSIVNSFNQSGTAGYTVLDVNPTETTTGSGTKLLQRWAVGGTAKAQVNNNGALWADIVYCTNVIGFSTSIGGSGDLTLVRDAADTLALRRGTSAQTFRGYKSYIDGSNNRFLSQSWSGSTAIIRNVGIGTEAGSGALMLSSDAGGNIDLAIANVAYWRVAGAGAHLLAVTDNSYDIGASGANRPRNVFAAGVVSAGTYYGVAATRTVAALGAAAGLAYSRTFVSDSSVAAAGNFGAIVAGGGANIVPVYSDGTNWRIG